MTPQIPSIKKQFCGIRFDSNTLPSTVKTRGKSVPLLPLMIKLPVPEIIQQPKWQLCIAGCGQLVLSKIRTITYLIKKITLNGYILIIYVTYPGLKLLYFVHYFNVLCRKISKVVTRKMNEVRQYTGDIYSWKNKLLTQDGGATNNNNISNCRWEI